jgi:hypothetical protein
MMSQTSSSRGAAEESLHTESATNNDIEAATTIPITRNSAGRLNPIEVLTLAYGAGVASSETQLDTDEQFSVSAISSYGVGIPEEMSMEEPGQNVNLSLRIVCGLAKTETS